MSTRSLPVRPAQVQFPNLGRRMTMLALLALVMIHGSVGWSEDEAAADPLEELKARISQLEQDNRALRTALSKTEDDSLVPLISELPPMPTESDDSSKSPEDRKMESLVEGLIRRMNAQTLSQTDSQNQRIAALERQIAGLSKAPKPNGATGSFGNLGILFTSNDGNFKSHFGGTAQLDFIAPQSTSSVITGLGGPNQNLTQDSTNFRRLRMRADGTMYGWIDWVSEFDITGFVQNTNNLTPSMANNGLRSIGTLNPGVPGGSSVQGGNSLNVVQPTTVWMTFKDIPVVQNIRVGNQQDWFSIEHITSARFLDFMERAPIMDTFSGPNNNGYTPGVSVFGNTPDKNAGLQLGIYKNNAYDADYTFSVGNAFTYGGRAIWTPYYDECSNGRYLVHTAFATEYRSFDTSLAASQNGENVRVRSRGDLRIVTGTITPNFADTGNFFALGQTMLNPEFAVVWGPWTFQGEYIASWYNGAKTTQLAGGTNLGTAFMYGGYLEALYFLTGENKSYNRQTGLFNQVVPIKNVNFSKCEYGCWQVGTRYDWMDLNSGLITGGRNQAGTIGLNWWINPMIRFQFNTVFTYINNGANPVIAGPVGSAASGTLQGAKFTGDGLIVTIGSRMDISF